MPKEKTKKEKSNIVKFRRGFQFNIGVIIAVIFILYMGFHVVTSITKKSVVAYQVTLGTIVEKNLYQGLILRKEEVYRADRQGTVYYYEKNKSRVGVRSKIYAQDTTGNVIGQFLSGNDGYRMLETEDLSDIYPVIDSFVGHFNPVNFQTTYSFKNDINDYLSEIRARGLANEYSVQIENAKSAGTYFDYYAAKPGFLVYSLDGYEGKTLDSITPEDFYSGSLVQKNLRSNAAVNVEDPVYKLITDDNWNVVIPIDSRKAAELSEMLNLHIRFTQDNTTTWATAQIQNVTGNIYLILTLDDSMERYADQRFVNVELLFDEVKGLKIPNSALVEKECFTVSKACFTNGGNNNEPGLMIRREGQPDTFVNPPIFYENDDMYYIDDELVSEGDLIVLENSRDTVMIGQTKDSLTGVYCINKGYAQFRRVEITFNNEDYSIIKNQASYSVSLYDHIVLDATSVKENEII